MHEDVPPFITIEQEAKLLQIGRSKARRTLARISEPWMTG